MISDPLGKARTTLLEERRTVCMDVLAALAALPDDQVPALAALAAAKVGHTPTRALLLEHRLHTALAQGAEQEIGRKIGIAEQ